MRWVPFFVLAYVMLGLQVGLGGLVGGVNFVLIAAVFVALNGARNVAVPACFVLGLLQDLAGTGPVGTFALAYAVVAILIAGTDRALSAEHPLTHFVITGVAGVVVALILWLHGHLARHGVPLPLGQEFAGVLYTAVAALPALWLLNRLRRSFRFRYASRQ